MSVLFTRPEASNAASSQADSTFRRSPDAARCQVGVAFIPSGVAALPQGTGQRGRQFDGRFPVVMWYCWFVAQLPSGVEDRGYRRCRKIVSGLRLADLTAGGSNQVVVVCAKDKSAQHHVCSGSGYFHVV